MIDIAQFEKEGFAITAPLFSLEEVQQLITLLEQQKLQDEGPRRGGLRDVLDNLPALRTMADHAAIRAVMNQVLGKDAFVVRATLFDKTEASNWKVPWHQDVTIAVTGRSEVPGYGPWSNKAGVMHVQPPSEVLERMVTVRVHLDDCPASNGALRVMPGTHRLGKLNQNEVSPYVEEERSICCAAAAGEALVMRPLLLHASSAAEHPGHRRVLHFDYAVGDLADGLEWRMRAEAETKQITPIC
jgi:ectoine hydroxylase-related dioxygenase (phytanoyl-CoA dioxygenase family)